MYDNGRIDNIIGILHALLTWPHFLVGFGIGAQNNWEIPGVLFGHDAHQGMLQIWLNTGVVGFVSFYMLIWSTLSRGVRKIRKAMCFEHSLLMTGLVLSICCWLILFNTTKGRYTGGLLSLYLILTTEIGLLVALSQKRGIK